MTFAADGLPDGLTLDAQTGRITGIAPRPASTPSRSARPTPRASAEKPFKIVIGDAIALDPADGLEQLELLGRRRRPGQGPPLRPRDGRAPAW